MSKREIKDEHKEREGAPRIKARLRELRAEWAKRAKSIQRVADADVLLTNPTHYAVAIQYRHGEMPAPRLLAKGVGTHVVGGNYVIGMIVFLILVVVQYVVVTNGAQRVSEVAARFTLDSMPGQQMSIDADLNMGFIDQEEAKRRRKTLEREAAFYGAMDGASKFVKGDAIAGIIIMLINVVGGLVIGVLQQGMPWGEALRHFTLLTIGDGIVTQIPALGISVGTGLIVTRSASDNHLSAEVLRQFTAFPRTLAIVTVVVLGVGALPGIPVWPVLFIATLVGTSYCRRNRARRRRCGPKPSNAVSLPTRFVRQEPLRSETSMVSPLTSAAGLARLSRLMRDTLQRQAARPGNQALDTTSSNRGPETLPLLLERRIAEIRGDETQRKRLLKRMLIESVLLEQFGPELVNDLAYQAVVDDVLTTLEGSASCRLDLDRFSESLLANVV
jgi:hypothetical protein